MSELISVIIPVYNIAPYISRCIDSIISQSYKNFELILVDDGSSDNSGVICDEYASKDNRIKVIHKENGGVSSARNIGMDEAKGEYITFIDGDDYINTFMLEKLLSTIKETKADISMCDLCVVDLSGNTKRVDIENQVFSKEFLISNYFFNPDIKELLWGPCQKLFKSETLKDIRFKNYSVGEDLLFVFEVLQKIDMLAYTNYDGYFYVHREGSAARSSFSKKEFDYIYAARDIVSLCEDNAPYAAKTANQWLFQNSLVLFRRLVINDLITTYKNEYFELRSYLKSNRNNCFKGLELKRKIDYFLLMHFKFLYKIIKNFK